MLAECSSAMLHEGEAACVSPQARPLFHDKPDQCYDPLYLLRLHSLSKHSAPDGFTMRVEAAVDSATFGLVQVKWLLERGNTSRSVFEVALGTSPCSRGSNESRANHSSSENVQVVQSLL